jgi:hypothetical protein
MKLEIDWLKKNHQMIHFFGLGFIQLKLDDYSRLHFYTTKFKPIIADDSAHNHRYDFISHILVGKLIQHSYHFEEDFGGKFILEEEACLEGYLPEKAPVSGSLILQGVQEFSAGVSYTLTHDRLHRVEVREDTITYLLRGTRKKDLAEVVRLKDAEKICPFSMKISEDELWQIVAEMLPKQK